MSLTAKPQLPHAHKKAKGEHHRHSKSYLKTYWPYIPILLIVALGFYLNHIWKVNHPVANLSSYTYYDLLESSIALLALALFLLRHAFAWHKVLVKEEQFATKHPILDVLLVIVAVGGLLLSHHLLA